MFIYDRASHFISCLHLVDENIRRKRKDEANIRWIVIGLHDALYAILIEKLTRTDGFGIYNDNFEKTVGNFYEDGLSSNSQEFHDLMEKSFTENIAGIGRLLQRANLKSEVVINESDVEKLSRPSLGLSHLKKMRNFLAHPRPMLSGYYEHWLIDAFEDTIDVIREVATLPGYTRAHYDLDEAQVILNSIEFYLRLWAMRMMPVEESKP
ncbi:hypothetical protein [Thalassovita gelatinovora]|nr:hypothetical protein [Thalassovita gelatinovora]